MSDNDNEFLNSLDPLLVTSTAIGVSFLLVLLTGFTRYHWITRRTPFDGIPCPPNPHWFLGHVGWFRGKAFHDTLYQATVAHANDCGQTGFWVLCFGQRAVSVTDGDDARAILNSTTYRNPLVFLRRHMHRFLGNNNIGLLNGAEWKFHRSAVLRSFSPKNQLANTTTIHKAICRVLDTLLESITEKLQQKDSDSDSSSTTALQMDIEALMKMITVDVFGTTALGEDFECCKHLRPSRIAVAFDYLGREFSDRMFAFSDPTKMLYSIPTAANRRHARERKYIRGFLNKLVRQHQEKQQGKDEKTTTASTSVNKDLLSNLLEAHRVLKEQGELEDDVSTDTVSDVLMSLLFAGYDTTSITLTYALYHVAKHPELESILYEEITRQGLDDFSRLEYCKAFILETLRLYPPGPTVSRTLTKDVRLSGGFVAPKGTFAFVPIWTIQRNEKLYPKANEFHPERWVKREESEEGAWQERGETDELPDMIAPANRRAFLAFSSGGRSCAGYKFAMQEAITVFSFLVKHLTFNLPKDYVVEPHRVGIVQSPKGVMPMSIALRK